MGRAIPKLSRARWMYKGRSKSRSRTGSKFLGESGLQDRRRDLLSIATENIPVSRGSSPVAPLIPLVKPYTARPRVFTRKPKAEVRRAKNLATSANFQIVAQAKSAIDICAARERRKRAIHAGGHAGKPHKPPVFNQNSIVNCTDFKVYKRRK